MEKYGVQAAFWDLVASHFGYRDDAPSLKNLLIRLLVSDLDHACRAPLPEGLKHLMLSRQGTANAVVCLAQWRDSSTRGPSYEALSAAVAEAVKLEQHLGALEIEDLAEVKTFLLVEKAIASRLRDRVLETADLIKPEAVRDIAARRQDGYWASAGLPDTASAPRRALHAVYEALQIGGRPPRAAQRAGRRAAPAGCEGVVLRLHRQPVPLRPVLPPLLRGRGLRRVPRLGRAEVPAQADRAGLRHRLPRRAGAGLEHASGGRAARAVAARRRAQPTGLLRARGGAGAGQGTGPPGLRHHQRRLPLRGRAGAGRAAQRQVPLRRRSCRRSSGCCRPTPRSAWRRCCRTRCWPTTRGARSGSTACRAPRWSSAPRCWPRCRASRSGPRT